MNHSPLQKTLPFPASISLIYLLLGTLWILFSDRIAANIAGSEDELLFVSQIKGWAFIGVSTLLLYLLLLRDYRKQTRSYQQLFETQRRFEIATQSSGIGVWDLDLLDNQLVWDEHMYELYDVDKEQFNGAYEAWERCVYPDDLEQAEAELAAAVNNQRELNTTFRIRRSDGSIRHIQAAAAVVRNENGTPVRLIGINWDVTDRIENESRFKELFERTPAGVAMFRPTATGREFKLVAINPAGLGDESSARSERIGCSVQDMFHDADNTELVEAFQSVHTSGQATHYPLIQYRNEHIEKWIEMDLFRLPSGLIVALYNDITSQQKAQEQIQLQASVLDQIQDYVLVTDLAGTITYANRAEEVLFRRPAQKLIGLSIDFYNRNYDIGISPKEIIEATLRDGQWRGELEQKLASGERVLMDCRTQIVHDATGKPNGVCGISTDITDRKKYETELKRQNVELEQFNRMATGRELRMIELKKEINTLCRELGRDEPY